MEGNLKYLTISIMNPKIKAPKITSRNQNRMKKKNKVAMDLLIPVLIGAMVCSTISRHIKKVTKTKDKRMNKKRKMKMTKILLVMMYLIKPSKKLLVELRERSYNYCNGW